MTVQFENEKKDLETKMTLKKKKITQTATLRLREKEQRATSDMVKKQSMEMLSLLAAKQEEIKMELQKTLEQELVSAFKDVLQALKWKRLECFMVVLW